MVGISGVLGGLRGRESVVVVVVVVVVVALREKIGGKWRFL